MDDEHDRSPSDMPTVPPVENQWVETLKTIGFSVILALGIRTFVADSRFIPSGSMLPTLQVDDRLIIDKISYRFVDPQRGDIVVFNPTAQLEKELQADGEPKYKEPFIKRVIGLPGDRVDVKAGKVYINGKVLSENYLGEPPKYNWSSREVVPDGIVPPGNYLVLGDNRNNSYDGHYWGFLPKEKILGRAIVRFWPINRVGGIDPQPNYR
jgi:signal peptidase I